MKKLLLSSITLLFCVSMLAQKSVDLKLNPEKNKTYRFRSSTDQTVTQTSKRESTDNRFQG
jgi:hypothetical protein